MTPSTIPDGGGRRTSRQSRRAMASSARPRRPASDSDRTIATSSTITTARMTTPTTASRTTVGRGCVTGDQDADRRDQRQDEVGERLEERVEHDPGRRDVGGDRPLPVQHEPGRDVGRPGDRAHDRASGEVGADGVRPGQARDQDAARRGVGDVGEARRGDEGGELDGGEGRQGRRDRAVVDDPGQDHDEDDGHDADQQPDAGQDRPTARPRLPPRVRRPRPLSPARSAHRPSPHLRGLRKPITGTLFPNGHRPHTISRGFAPASAAQFSCRSGHGAEGQG